MPKKILKLLAAATLIIPPGIFSANSTNASGCPDVKAIFARGSGGERYNTDHYQNFKKTIEEKIKPLGLQYEFDDLDYPAVGVGPDNLLVSLGAFFGGGDAYEFGDSVHDGINNLVNIINNSPCKNTKYVLGGYSQGAIVITKTLDQINPDKIIYAATFGDPKIFLPEGAGPVPTACSGKGLSDYRIYVPDCRAYAGLLGAKNPYRSNAYIDKIGTWCNKYDIFCSSHFSITSHTSYVKDGIYEDASRFITSKIAKAFGKANSYISPHDTAILIDSTSSMEPMTEKYKSEALNLAKRTFDAGGRVALFDYRDLADPYELHEWCNYDTCTYDVIEKSLDNLTFYNGGDWAESLLSASFNVMKRLEWRLGSTKSLVIITDADYHSPDLDGTSFYDVKKLSQEIDPVNFYIVTTDENREVYQPLANATGGAVIASTKEMSIKTNEIMEKYDSLPRVEESSDPVDDAPDLTVTSTEQVSENEYKISFSTTGKKTIVVLNGAVLGITEEKNITISDLNPAKENILSLTPLSDSMRGKTVDVALTQKNSGSVSGPTIIPKAPNTGGH